MQAINLYNADGASAKVNFSLLHMFYFLFFQNTSIGNVLMFKLNYCIQYTIVLVAEY